MRLPDRVERVDVPTGYDGTLRTLRLMSDAIGDGRLDPRIRTRVRELFRGLAPYDHDGEIAAIWQHVLDHVRFQYDPVGAEHITSPGELDRQVDEGLAAEDCDGMVVYSMALLAAAGIQSQFEIIGWDPSKPSRYGHVALVAIDPQTKQPTSFDVVAAQRYPGFPLGASLWRPGLPRKRFDLDVKEVPIMLQKYVPHSTLAGVAFGDLGDAGEEKAGNILDQIKAALPALGPYGMLGAGVVRVGESVYEASTGRRLGTPLPAGGAVVQEQTMIPGQQPDGTVRNPLALARGYYSSQPTGKPVISAAQAAKMLAPPPPDGSVPSSSPSKGLAVAGLALAAAKLLGAF